jgi:WXG100 family type VII secretion target
MSITYNFGAIGDVATAIGTYQGNLDVELGELYNAFRAMLAADWTGPAGTACDEAQQQWNQGATEIKEALARLGVKLGASADRMSEVDSRISAGF